jgi:hypothetical protein
MLTGETLPADLGSIVDAIAAIAVLIQPLSCVLRALSHSLLGHYAAPLSRPKRYFCMPLAVNARLREAWMSWISDIQDWAGQSCRLGIQVSEAWWADMAMD